MDPLSALLDGPRARAAFALRAVMAAPWGIEVRDRAPLTVVALVRGAAHVEPADGEPVALAPGDLAVVQGPDAYRLTDAPGSEVDVVVLPGQRCVDLEGEPVSERMSLGARSWGNAATGETTMLIGTWTGDGELGRRLLDAIPPLLVLRAGDCPRDGALSGLTALLAAELQTSDPGQPVVLDRLLDLLLVSAIRAWAATGGAGEAAWMTSDAVVRDALQRVHADPARPRSLAAMAADAGLSRAAFSRRFVAAVGEPPIAYLIRWRMDLAAERLREPGAAVAAVGRSVGYADPFTFSAAFKRQLGRSPRAYAQATPEPLVPAAGDRL